MKKLAFLAVATGLAFSASAQAPVGTVQDVKGSVTISNKAAVKRATSGMAVTEGASILVASDGAGTLVLNNGCSIALKGCQHITVNAALKCSELQASVKNLFPACKVAQAPVGGGLVAPPAAGGAAAGATAGSGMIAVGGLVAGIAAGIVSNESSSDDPISAQ